jgi:uncharacterized protein
MRENPFVYGEIVPSAAFADREVEFDRLARDLAAGQKVFLISPRRYGKSSLIRQVLRHLARKRVLTVEVTVAASSSYVGFLEAFARALLAAGAPAASFRASVTDLFGDLRPEVRRETGTTGPRGEAVGFPSVRTDRDVARLAARVFELPGRIAAARKRRLAVALDEFQEIGAFNGGSVEQALRAAVQQQRDVGYVFAGSEPSLMERMIGPKRPFYKAGPVMRLDRIPEEAFARFVEARFAAGGIRAEAGLGAAIVELAGNVPYDVQRLAHEVWDDVRSARNRVATLEDLHATLTRLLHEQHLVFEQAWQRLTLAQRGVLRAVALEQGREMLSADVRVRHRLSTASSVQSALAALVREDVVTKEGPTYALTDSLFREWVVRTTF